MKTNCKKWKYLLITTAVATAFGTAPIVSSAATVSKTTLSKMNSNNTAAGAAVVLDVNISESDFNIQQLVRESSLALKRKTEEKKTELEEQQDTLVMANVNQYVNIRESADQDAEKVGVLYKDCGGELIEQKDGWTKLKSGDVTGWVKDDYLYFGEEAKELAESVGILTAYSNTQTLRVRKSADINAPVLGLLSEGEALEAISEDGDWVSVSYEGTTGFVSADYVKVEFELDTAESIEVIKAREAAEQKKAEEKAKKNAERNAQREAAIATGDELRILAALIQCEAGGEPYEGQVAVGAVVMNRVRCGAYPNNITDVIYASGQFTPASGGRMQSLILNGNIKASCIQAAQEAINGVTNVGDALHFRRANGKDGIIIGNQVFW